MESDNFASRFSMWCLSYFVKCQLTRGAPILVEGNWFDNSVQYPEPDLNEDIQLNDPFAGIKSHSRLASQVVQSFVEGGIFFVCMFLVLYAECIRGDGGLVFF